MKTRHVSPTSYTIGVVTNSRLETAVMAARKAGRLLLQLWDEEPTGVDEKTSARDLVSDADRDAEILLVKLLNAAFPNDAIVGEEFGAVEGTSGLCWGIDPLDGTSNYLSRLPHWCVSIGCEDENGSVVGVVFDPLRNEMFTAVRGGPVMLNGKVAAARPHTAEMHQVMAALGPTTHERWARHRDHLLSNFVPRIAHARHMGSLALDLAWTAFGRFDLYYYDCSMHEWDIAQRVLLESAGLQVGTWYEHGDLPSAILAAPPELYEEALALLRNP